MADRVTIQKRLNPRQYEQLPIQHFVVVEDWIPKLTEKTYCAWLKLYSWTYVSPFADDPENETVPATVKQLFQKLGVEQATFRHIIQTLWEYEFIDFHQSGNNEIQIIVYPYPQNRIECSTQPIEKTRDFIAEEKHLLPIFDDNALSKEVSDWIENNAEKINNRASIFGRLDIQLDDIKKMYRLTKGHISDKEFIMTLEAMITRKFQEILDFEQEFREVYKKYVQHRGKAETHQIFVQWIKKNQNVLEQRRKRIGTNDIRLARIVECYQHFAATIPLYKFLQVLDMLVQKQEQIVDFIQEFHITHLHLIELEKTKDAREDGTLDKMKELQRQAARKKEEERLVKNPNERRKQLILGQTSTYDDDENMTEEELQKLREETKKAISELLKDGES